MFSYSDQLLARVHCSYPEQLIFYRKRLHIMVQYLRSFIHFLQQKQRKKKKARFFKQDDYQPHKRLKHDDTMHNFSSKCVSAIDVRFYTCSGSTSVML